MHNLCLEANREPFVSTCAGVCGGLHADAARHARAGTFVRAAARRATARCCAGCYAAPGSTAGSSMSAAFMSTVYLSEFGTAIV